MEMRVVLPAPLGPNTPKMAPGATVRFTWRSTSLTGPNNPVRNPLPIPWAKIAGGIIPFSVFRFDYPYKSFNINKIVGEVDCI